MSEVVTPVPAATLLLLRDGPTGLETFMVVRHHEIDFATGALVFPGGKVDDGDSEVRDWCDGVDDADDITLSLKAGGIREAFEECGILLAREKETGELVGSGRLGELDHYRDELHQGKISMRAFCEQEQLVLACDLLQKFAHWITPPMMPKRFDTHFYAAAAPADHIAAHDGHESVDSIWISPQDAVKGNRDGTYTVIFPTLLNIEMLGESDSVADAMDKARARNIVTVEPWTEQREDGNYLCIPAAAGYSISEQKMPERAAS